MVSVCARAVCIGFFLAICWWPGQQAGAQSQVIAPTSGDPLSAEFIFNVPAGRVVDTIIELSRQSGVSILVDEDLAAVEVEAIAGRHDLGPLLASLFSQESVEISVFAGGVTIRKLRSGPPMEAPPLTDAIAAGSLLVDKPLYAPKIHVFGFREALRSAVDLKQESLGVSEVILSEDIGRYPDLNLAESLQRMPGVTITRERGEGAEMSLRGLGAEFTRVQIDGLPVLINSNRDRGFEFSALSSDLFQRVDVRKSYEVSLDEGGIGGTVLLTTPSPFDYDANVGVLSAALGSNSNSEALDHKAFGMISLREQTGEHEFGLLLSVTESARVSEGQDASTYRYRAAPIAEVNLSALEPVLAEAFADGTVFMPRGNRYRVSQEDQDRIGATLALQWRKGSELEVSAKALYGRHEIDRRANNIQTRGQNSFPVDTAFEVDGETYGPSLILDAIVNDQKELVYAVFQDAVIGAENTATIDKSEFWQLGVSANWTHATGANVSARLGYAQYQYGGREDKFYLETVADLSTDYRGRNRLNPRFDYGIDTNLADASQWRAHEFDLRQSRSENELSLARVDAVVPLGAHLEFKSGFSVQSFDNEERGARAENVLLQAFETGDVNDDVSSFVVPFTDHYNENWVRTNVDKALRHYQVNRSEAIGLLESDFLLRENTYAGYGALHWDGVIDGLIDAELGIRVVNNQRSVLGLPLAINDVEVTTTNVAFDDESWEVLPALNVRYEPMKDWAFRLAVSRNVTYPPITALDPTTRVRTNTFVPDAVVGSALLEPYRASNVDIYADYSWSGGTASLGFFHKSVENFVTLQAKRVPFRQLGLPEELLEPGQDRETIFSVSTYSNAQDTTLQGVELAVQAEFDEWVPSLVGLGGVFNATYASGDFDYSSIVSSDVITASFPGLSEYSANLAVFYETEWFGVRSALAYRSDYVTAIEPGLPEEDSRGRLGTVFLDASAYLNLSEQTQLTLDALNLTGEEELDYSDTLERLTERRKSGTTVFLGLRHKF